MIMRYPGGKGGQLEVITRRLKQQCHSKMEFREPFFGAGAVGLHFIETNPEPHRFWFNDYDPCVSALWRVVATQREDLCSRIRNHVPGIWYFDFFKPRLEKISSAEDLANYIESGVAFMKLVLHQTSFSGLGTRSGGPLGGRHQSGDTRIDSRFNAAAICKKLEKAAAILSQVNTHPEICTCLDFEEVLRAPGDALFYVDPPYFKAGPGLYQFAFSENDHVRLADRLKSETRPWLLSYDDHHVVRDLYAGWAEIEVVQVRYSVSGAVRSQELLIRNWR